MNKSIFSLHKKAFLGVHLLFSTASFFIPHTTHTLDINFGQPGGYSALINEYRRLETALNESENKPEILIRMMRILIEIKENALLDTHNAHNGTQRGPHRLLYLAPIGFAPHTEATHQFITDHARQLAMRSTDTLETRFAHLINTLEEFLQDNNEHNITVFERLNELFNAAGNPQEGGAFAENAFEWHRPSPSIETVRIERPAQTTHAAANTTASFLPSPTQVNRDQYASIHYSPFGTPAFASAGHAGFPQWVSQADNQQVDAAQDDLTSGAFASAGHAGFPQWVSQTGNQQSVISPSEQAIIDAARALVSQVPYARRAFGDMEEVHSPVSPEIASPVGDASVNALELVARRHEPVLSLMRSRSATHPSSLHTTGTYHAAQMLAQQAATLDRAAIAQLLEQHAHLPFTDTATVNPRLVSSQRTAAPYLALPEQPAAFSDDSSSDAQFFNPDLILFLQELLQHASQPTGAAAAASYTELADACTQTEMTGRDLDLVAQSARADQADLEESLITIAHLRRQQPLLTGSDSPDALQQELLLTKERLALAEQHRRVMAHNSVALQDQIAMLTTILHSPQVQAALETLEAVTDEEIAAQEAFTIERRQNPAALSRYRALHTSDTELIRLARKARALGLFGGHRA